jgi:methionyl-tRNA synthetase
VKEDKRAAGKVLYTAGEALRISALLLSPVMPNRTKTLLDILDAFDSNQKWGGLKPGTQLNDHAPLFPRIK